MFVRKKSGELPADAIVVTREEALRNQLSLIRDWEKSSDVWPFRYGIGVLAIAASSAGMYFNSYYRRKLRLGKIGLLSSYVPIVVLPGMMSGIIHTLFVTHNLVLEETKCPVCLQARAVGMQVAIGFAYPLVLAAAGNFVFALRQATYRIPDLSKDPFGPLKILHKFSRQIGPQLSLIFVGQGLLASWFTYMEGKSYYKLKDTMLKIEEEWENSQNNVQ